MICFFSLDLSYGGYSSRGKLKKFKYINIVEGDYRGIEVKKGEEIDFTLNMKGKTE